MNAAAEGEEGSGEQLYLYSVRIAPTRLTLSRLREMPSFQIRFTAPMPMLGLFTNDF